MQIKNQKEVQEYCGPHQASSEDQAVPENDIFSPRHLESTLAYQNRNSIYDFTESDFSRLKHIFESKKEVANQ